MPKRRTEDVVHVAVTDHYIQRRKPAGDLLAERPERHETGSSAYRGPVVLYYPETLPHTPENDLYLAVAQVNQSSNLRAGIASAHCGNRKVSARSARNIIWSWPRRWRDSGELAKALPVYREAIRRNPKFVPGLQKLGVALRRSGQYSEASGILKRAASVAPDNASTWHELGLTYRALGNKPDAVAAIEKAARVGSGYARSAQQPRHHLVRGRRAGARRGGVSRGDPDSAELRGRARQSGAIFFPEPAISARRAIISKLRSGCGRTMPLRDTTMRRCSGAPAISTKRSASWRRPCAPIPDSRMPTSFWETC